MFALDAPPSRHRVDSESFPSSVSYRQQECYIPDTINSNISHSSQDGPSHYYTGEKGLYQNTGEPVYESSPDYCSDGQSIPSPAFNSTYNHRVTTSDDVHLSTSFSPYDIQSKPVLSSLPQTKRNVKLDGYNLTSTHSSFPDEIASAVTASESPGDYDWPSNSPQAFHQDAAKPRKIRREKPRIELAPDQPPTTQGKPRARVYVACLQCRTRKIRCDGAKPVCHNCGRRSNGNECNYDPIPKRRGPDKMPGARQRVARDTANGIEHNSTRRRRRTRDNSIPAAIQLVRPATQNPLPIPESHQIRTNSPISLINFSAGSHDDITCTADNFIPVPNYSRSSYSLCGCHGLPHCPGVRHSDAKKSIYVPNHRDDSEASNMMPPYTIDRAYVVEVDQNGNERDHSAPEIASEPSLNFSRKIWWDSLLSLYLSPSSTRLHSLTMSQRESATHSITADLRFIFRASNYWFSFFHIPSFFGNFFDPVKRQRVQPSLILALLAMSTFWQSSEVGFGKVGRERALRFRDEAQAAMDASFNAGWIDETLAQTAWLLALFEVCAHPRHSTERSTSSMVMLDSIIRSLSLTSVDADNPNASMFSPGTVPAVDSPKPRTYWYPEQSLIPRSSEIPYDNASQGRCPNELGCSCRSFTLNEHWPLSIDHAPLWASTPAWDDTWSDGDIRKESCRRLCWSAMILAAGHISYTAASRSEALDLFIADPANYALLFSGESVARSPVLSMYSSKDTIWALHDRSFLLWHGCIRMRNSGTAIDSEKAHFAVTAWLEADSLEETLNRHTCAIERAFIFQAREYIFNTRMCISYEFQRYIPLATANVSGLFHRKKAEEWLTHQATVAERFMYGLHTITGNSTNLLARRPFFVFWFMGQIHRALLLWECDNTLTVALDVCKALIPAIDYLTALWPCSEQRHRYKSLREKVRSSCFVAGIEPPPPIDLSLPLPPASREALV